MTRLPLACDPAAIPPEDRPDHLARAERLFGSALARQEQPDGVELRLSVEAFQEVARFVENERRCCPFLTFTIQVEPGRGEVRLRTSGPEGVREFLAAELGWSVLGLNRPRKPPAGTCPARHPLLEEVWCARLPGHPGEHRASLAADAADVNLEWRDGTP